MLYVGIERRVLVHAVAQRVLQIVVHPEAGADDGLAAERTPGQPDARLRQELGVVDGEDGIRQSCGWLEITPFVKV